MINMAQKHLDEEKQHVRFPVSPSSLVSMSMDQFTHHCKIDGRKLTIVHGLVHDIEPFINEHPGGKAFINSAVGNTQCNTLYHIPSHIAPFIHH